MQQVIVSASDRGSQPDSGARAPSKCSIQMSSINRLSFSGDTECNLGVKNGGVCGALAVVCLARDGCVADRGN